MTGVPDGIRRIAPVWLLLCQPVWAQQPDANALVRDAETPADVLVYGMGYGQQRHSPLDRINTDNVRHLAPRWLHSLDDDQGQQAFPLVHEGVIYVTTHDATLAVDGRTGRGIWRTSHVYDQAVLRSVCCGVVNRGAAIHGGRLFRQLLDGHVVALNLADGKVLWDVDALADLPDRTGFIMNAAPLVANGVLITGVSGADYGARCFLDGRDPATGKRLWRRFTVPAPGEPGGETWPADAWQRGGGSTWLTGSYDPQLDLVYWGVGNPAPYNPTVRPGDNLYTNSVLALKPETGAVAWHFQFTPNDPFDYDGNNELVLADLPVDGKPRPVLMQANRNGFFYVLDRRDGTFLRGTPYVKVNWAAGLDGTGRPITTDLVEKVRRGEKVTVWPGGTGGKNWSPMAFDRDTGLAYVNTNHYAWDYQINDVEYRAGLPYWGVTFSFHWDEQSPYRGHLKAIDPLTGRAKWEVPQKTSNYAAVLVTAGNLLVTGQHTGELVIYDKRDGRLLWSFQTGSGIVGQPITWEAGDEQFITVLSGSGGLYAKYSGDPALRHVPGGGLLLNFALPK